MRTKMTIAEKLERKHEKNINQLTYSAASILRQKDINNTHNVALAWDNFEKIYKVELKPYVEYLIKSNHPHIWIPREACKLWMNDFKIPTN